MIVMRVILDGEECWSDLNGKRILRATDLQIASLAVGTTSGHPSIAIRVDLENGETAIAETSLKLLLAAADLFKAKYGDPR